MKFTSIDPITGKIVTDPSQGFLPPNVSPPEGDGSIFFTIAPKGSLATGIQLTNRATVVFDVNAPILTPTWTNTVDNDKPVSEVLFLGQTQQSLSFPVQWSGTDVGSGIQNFTIYVSDNDEPFTVWLQNSVGTSATFTGQPGHKYAFHSTARDMVSNVENLKIVPDAVTTVVADTTSPVTTATVTGPAGNNGWYRGLVTVGLSASDPDSPVAATYFRLDGSAVSTYTGPFTIRGDGIHQLWYSSSDPSGNQEQWRTLTIKVDQTSPSIDITPSTRTLWPPNGKMIPVTFTGVITDTDSGADAAAVTFVVMDAYGIIRTGGVVALGLNGAYSFAIPLEASRDGGDKDGRRYTIVVTAQDNAGNEESRSTTVLVPHDQGR